MTPELLAQLSARAAANRLALTRRSQLAKTAATAVAKVMNTLVK